MNLRSHRNALGISQSKLARISGVSRFKICTYELGSGSLSLAQQSRIREALQMEAERLRKISIQIESGQLSFEAGLHHSPGFGECGGVGPC
jgi:predicted transcriptional regulator